VALGPGHAALGRGHLALDELDTARRHLETAWHDGYQAPEVACNLGLVMARLYQKELMAADRLSNATERERRRRQAEVEYRDPAVAYLRSGSGADLLAPEYVDALLAFCEGRYDHALDKAREAFERVGWLYEAKLLEGSILNTLSSKQANQGQTDHALASLRAAEAAYQQAIRIAESDVRCHAGLCTARSMALYFQIWRQGRGQEETLESVLEACEVGLMADPDWAPIHTELASANSNWGQKLYMAGQDPTRHLESAIQAGREATRLDPEIISGWSQLGLAYWTMGRWEVEAEKDPRASFREAIAAAREAIAIAAGDEYALNILGLVYLDLGLYQDLIEEDPVEALGQAVEIFEGICELNPDNAIDATNAAIAYWGLIDHRINRLDQDPTELITTALAWVDAALEANPEYHMTHRTLGEIHIARAQWAMARGQDPRPAVAAALKALRKSLAIHATDIVTHTDVVEALVLRAEFDMGSGTAAEFSTSLAAARAALREAENVNPTFSFLMEQKARLDSLLADSGH
jgi:tetratricopeptide (TPR) repeat protein